MIPALSADEALNCTQYTIVNNTFPNRLIGSNANTGYLIHQILPKNLDNLTAKFSRKKKMLKHNRFKAYRYNIKSIFSMDLLYFFK